ncbi:Metal tolerance protein 3 [Daldinia childiae]|uniref:Metal tolerance protein 3 n=1 Tax=Daldinia childiae TaxID=326645 RepID=UPI0014466C2A|nr:Metal tolerance protein 3 [Daldinia childiae]KAF3060955.1 Metal tolerance protein 3 [Daldinia childiae]
MSSLDNSTSDPRRGFVPYNRGSFLLLQDENPPPMSPRGPGALTHLLKSRSHSSLHNYGSTWRGTVPNVLDDEESGGLLPSMFSRPPSEPDDEAHRRSQSEERRLNQLLHSSTMRSMLLIGKSNPRYNWERYWKTEEQLSAMRKPLREYYERTNYLVQQYLYIDRLLDSSLPHDLLNEYNDLPHHSFKDVDIPATISEEQSSGASLTKSNNEGGQGSEDLLGPITPLTNFSSPQNVTFADGEAGDDTDVVAPGVVVTKKVKRTPKDIYRPTETTPLFLNDEEEGQWDGPKPEIPWLEEDEELDSGDKIVATAIYVNFTANVLLLAGKIAVVISVSSMSVLASLVDAVLDFLSTVIVWTTTWLISRQDQYKYPVGRRRLEPLGVLVFSVIMITSFVQVALESIQRLASPNHELVEVGIPALSIMLGTVIIKGLCWLWCRLVKNSSVQALADDAMTDVIFNTGSILFPIVGFYAKIWWLDALGGLVLSLVVIFNWSRTSLQHIKNLSGFSATADQRNILLYLTMRFAKTIKQIQGLNAYHSGDKLNVEVDIILDASTTLRDSHDLSESLGYVLESVPIVDRAFVHADYASYNLPTHMEQQSS